MSTEEEKLAQDIRSMFSNTLRGRYGMPQGQPEPEPTETEEDREERQREDANELANGLVSDVCKQMAASLTDEIVVKAAQDLGFAEKLGTIRVRTIARWIRNRIEDGIPEEHEEDPQVTEE